MKITVFITPTSSINTDNLVAPVRACFDQFGGVDKIIKGNVFIKVNATALNTEAITTPEVVLAVIKVVQGTKNPPKNIYVFDNSAFGMPTRVVFKVKNLAKRIKKLGAIPLYLDEQEPMVLDFNGKALDKPIPVPKILYENLIEHKGENTYINVPKLKTHLQAGITVCIKNQHGLLYDEEKLYNHHLIDEKIVEIYEKFPPDLNIVDATTVQNHGAVAFTKGWQAQMDLLLAGTDAVAVDRVGAELLGIPYENIKYLKLASDKELGCSNLDEIEIMPNKSIIEENKIKLNDIFEEIPLDMPEQFQIIHGKDHSGCRAGCKSMLEQFKLMTAGGKIRPFVGICGRGHNIKELDKITGSILVTGKCAVEELKEYFESRPDRDELKIYYNSEHFGITDFITPFRKASKISFKQLGKMMQLSLLKIMTGYIGAKRHKAIYKGMMG